MNARRLKAPRKRVDRQNAGLLCSISSGYELRMFYLCLACIWPLSAIDQRLHESKAGVDMRRRRRHQWIIDDEKGAECFLKVRETKF